MAGEAELWKRLPQDHVARSTRVPWYHVTFEHKLKPAFRKVLEEWSHVPPEEVIPHIHQAREAAWKVFPWPCIGEFWFIEQGLLRHPDYPQILQHMTTTTPAPRFLDLGTCLGQDVRTLLHDGVSPSTVYGADVLPDFRNAGYVLFQDSDRFNPSQFITGDIFSDVDELAKTRGTWDIVHVSMFLHIFSLHDQQVVSRNIMKLLKPGLGSMIVGTQTGSLDAGELKLQPPLCEPGEHKTIYRQNRESMKTLFEDAARDLEIKVRVWTEYDEDEERERSKGRVEKGDEWERQERFFAGSKERRIFFRVEIT